MDSKGYFLRIRGFKHSEFMPVKKNEKVDQVASKGCKAFIEFYFDNEHQMKPGRGIEERNAIIYQLFDWRISSFVADLGGLLVINEEDLKCPK